jgi:hypothetical protein
LVRNTPAITTTAIAQLKLLPSALVCRSNAELFRQFGAICTEPGNPRLRRTTWWGWEDSNFQPVGHKKPLFSTTDLAGCCHGCCPNRVSINASLRRRETQFSRAETKTPKRPLQFNGQIAETKCAHESPTVRGYSRGSAAFIVQPSPFTYAERGQITAAAIKYGLGTIFAFPVAAREGSLIAYGPDYLHMYSRAPIYVDRIIKGSKPADLPVEQPTKIELLVNLKTAKTLGIEVPLSLLIRADELIE